MLKEKYETDAFLFVCVLSIENKYIMVRESYKNKTLQDLNT